MDKVEAGLTDLMSVNGAMCVALVDSESGMVVGSQGSGMDVEIAAAASTEIVRAERRAMKELGITSALEDILITLDTQYHIIRPAQHAPGLFIYFVLDRARGNLALARRKVQDVDHELVV
jgi:predicted regulator of Ras-like GTPase activity (Roadblock/LC7/MglB family)